MTPTIERYWSKVEDGWVYPLGQAGKEPRVWRYWMAGLIDRDEAEKALGLADDDDHEDVGELSFHEQMELSTRLAIERIEALTVESDE